MVRGVHGRVWRRGDLSYSATVILQAVGNGHQYGFDVMDVTGLPSGTVYLALRRLEDAGRCDGDDALADAVKR